MVETSKSGVSNSNANRSHASCRNKPHRGHEKRIKQTLDEDIRHTSNTYCYSGRKITAHPHQKSLYLKFPKQQEMVATRVNRTEHGPSRGTATISPPDSYHATQDSRPSVARSYDSFQDEKEALFIPKIFQFIHITDNIVCHQRLVDN